MPDPRPGSGFDMAGLARLLESTEGPTVIVVGDVILDRYLRGEVTRISPEAPIPVLRLDESEPDDRLGGMANVAHNLLRLGAKVECVGVVGDDEDGRAVLGLLTDAGAGVEGIVIDRGRPTTRKTRMVAMGQQILRIDREADRPLDAAIRDQLSARISCLSSRGALWAVSDYAKGVVAESVMQAVVAAAGQDGGRIVVDPKAPSYGLYRGATLLTPNRKEAEAATQRRIGPALEGIEDVARDLMRLADLEGVVITLGGKGMFLARKTGEHLRVTQQARSVYDVTGAGDTVLALLSWALGSGSSLEQAVHLANLGAGLVVGRLGASAVSREDLLGAILDSPDAPSAKIVTLADLEVRVRERRGRGERIVFTNGCFDILHPGHVAYLRFARSRGDTLIVAINSDRSVKALKGEERPIQSERERASVVASLEYVDHVVIFDDLTPLDVLGRLRPDVLVKGEDWKEKGVVGRELVESYGGEVCLAPLIPGVSSTEILRRVTRKPGLEEKADTRS